MPKRVTFFLDIEKGYQLSQDEKTFLATYGFKYCTTDKRLESHQNLTSELPFIERFLSEKVRILSG